MRNERNCSSEFLRDTRWARARGSGSSPHFDGEAQEQTGQKGTVELMKAIRISRKRKPTKLQAERPVFNVMALKA
jgi:hypothetical protein